MRHCAAKVWNRHRWGSFPCSRMGVVERDGKFYCQQHDPVKVKAREEDQTRKWNQKQSAREHTFACVQAIASIGGDPESVGDLREALFEAVKSLAHVRDFVGTLISDKHLKWQTYVDLTDAMKIPDINQLLARTKVEL